jgi:UDP-glucuronate 4-epimerase
VVGIDNLNDYYDVSLKQSRLSRLLDLDGFTFHPLDCANRDDMTALFEREKPRRVIHLAAQAGVRYSLKNPHAYINANISGFLNVLEGCRQHTVEHLVFASSSSVYGGNTEMPSSTAHRVDRPLSLYAATKRSNELMAYSYSSLYRIPTTGLRFFTVYGPWGRPDMVMFLFTRAILADEPIDVYNHGKMRRDFTYVDDIVEGVLRVVERSPAPGDDGVPHNIYNIGHNDPVCLSDLIDLLERLLGRPAKRNLLPMQPGDVAASWADIDDLVRHVGYKPRTPIEVGVGHFVDWYREYYGQ